jgi:hypothetical protein
LSGFGVDSSTALSRAKPLSIPQQLGREFQAVNIFSQSSVLDDGNHFGQPPAKQHQPQTRLSFHIVAPIAS